MPSERGYHPPSTTVEYETPHDLFDRLWDQYGPFDLDPCGQAEKHYSAHRIVQNGGACLDGSTLELDGLANDWSGVVYMNPPYGRGIGAWCKKAVIEVLTGEMYKSIAVGPCTRVVALLPAKTDTRWWHRYIQGRAHVEFLRGRLRFHGTPASAPFPSAVVVWGDMP